MKSEKARDLARFNTSGSSGEPLVFYIGKERVSHDVAAKWRATRWWDVDIGDREIVIWGSPIELGAQDRLRALRDRLLRTRLLPAFEMSEQKLDHFIGEIRSMRPKMLFGYPSALSFIARHAQASGQQMDDLGIKVAFVTSERLYDEQRRQISKVFGCPVANGYGGRDAGFIAHECPHGGMHITAEDVIVEIVDQQGASLPCGTAGEIVVTHLATKDFPFIRYRTGDIGVLDGRSCTCGRGLPLLKEIQGRSTDFFVAQDGTVMHGLALIYVLRDLPGIRGFKVVQEDIDHTHIMLVPADEFDKNIIYTIESMFKARLGQGVTITIEEVMEIAPEKSGKHRYLVSRVIPGARRTELKNITPESSEN
jgi:phenylacetate-CoA ligase